MRVSFFFPITSLVFLPSHRPICCARWLPDEHVINITSSKLAGISLSNYGLTHLLAYARARGHTHLLFVDIYFHAPTARFTFSSVAMTIRIDWLCAFIVGQPWNHAILWANLITRFISAPRSSSCLRSFCCSSSWPIGTKRIHLNRFVVGVICLVVQNRHLTVSCVGGNLYACVRMLDEWIEQVTHGKTNWMLLFIIVVTICFRINCACFYWSCTVGSYA